MPHFKGNKFKRAEIKVEIAAAADIKPAAGDGSGVGPSEPLATQAASGRTVADGFRKKSSKQQTRLQPVASTVVPPPPKVGTKGLVRQSNWAALKATIDKGSSIGSQGTSRKRKAAGKAVVENAEAAKMPRSLGAGDTTRVVAMDCEMVGVGPEGLRSVLARWVTSWLNMKGSVGFAGRIHIKAMHKPNV